MSDAEENKLNPFVPRNPFAPNTPESPKNYVQRRDGLLIDKIDAELRTKVTQSGQVVQYRITNGVEVIEKELGSIKDIAKKALFEAAMTKLDEKPDTKRMTAVELAAYQLAKKAAAGNREAITELLDRILGKPKQSVETKNLNLTLEDVLKQAVNEDGTVNLED